MINLIYTPQRLDLKAEYTIMDDVLKIKIGDKIELFDFTGLEEGYADSITADILPLNPVVSAKKVGDTVNVTVIRFYGADEKELFENV